MTFSSLTVYFYQLLFCFLIIILSAYYFFCKDKRYSKLAQQLPGPASWPIIGNGLDFIGDGSAIFQTFAKYFEKFPRPFRIWFGTQLTVVIEDPNELEVLCRNMKVIDKPKVLGVLKEIWGGGIFTASGQTWRKNRKRLEPCLKANVFKNYVPYFNKEIDKLIESIKDHVGKDEFDTWEYFCKFSFDSVMKTMLDVQLNSEERSNLSLHNYVKRGFEITFFVLCKPWCHIQFIKNLIYRSELQTIRQHMLKFGQEIMKKKPINNDGEYEVDGDDKDSKIGSYLRAACSLGQESNNPTLAYDEIVAITTGGTDTIAITLGSFLVMIAIHQDIQEKLYNEIYLLFGNTDREADAEDIKCLPYLDQALKEVLRKYPAAPFMFRSVDEDVKIGKYIYPRGTAIIIPIYYVHQNPKYYSDPMKFDPEHFSPEAVAKRPRLSFIPFSFGSRVCIGQGYTNLILKLAIVALLRKFVFHTKTKMENIELYAGFLMTIKDGYRVSIKLRK